MASWLSVKTRILFSSCSRCSRSAKSCDGRSPRLGDTGDTDLGDKGLGDTGDMGLGGTCLGDLGDTGGDRTVVRASIGMNFLFVIDEIATVGPRRREHTGL